MKIALVGRQNAGKSTLFNRLISKRRAIVSKIAGTTRDVNSGAFEYNGRAYQILDTGGFPIDTSAVSAFTEKRILEALSGADLALFILDGKAGLNPHDEIINRTLKKSGKKILPVINKADTKIAEDNIYDFYRLGYKDFIFVSAEEGSNISELLEAIEKENAEKAFPDENEERKILRFSIVGEANAGKSTVFNRLAGKDLRIVDSKPGTTRDYFELPVIVGGEELIAVDTAGLMRKTREFFGKISGIMTEKSVLNSDFCVFLIDASRPVSKYTYDIARMITSLAKGMLVVVNKWDLVRLKSDKKKEIEEFLLKHINFLNRAVILYVSAFSDNDIRKLSEKIAGFSRLIKKEHTIEELETILMRAYERRKPAVKSHPPEITGLKIIKDYPLTLKLKTSGRGRVPDDYRQFLENFFREYLNLTGLAVRILY